MASFANGKELDLVVGGFMRSLTRMDPIIREVTGHFPLKMKIELWEPELIIGMDLDANPMKITSGKDVAGEAAMSGPADVFHDLLLGMVPLGAAVNRKMILLRGPMSHLTAGAPMFFVSPYIYPFYLESIGRADLVAPGTIPLLHGENSKEGVMNTIVSKVAYISGMGLGFLKSKIAKDLDILAALEQMGKGLAKTSGNPENQSQDH